ncbi:MAG TPA: cell division protein ZapE [Methylovirgula sp.]|nr:cell division protein ZapE [Methylovirgula sp.]
MPHILLQHYSDQVRRGQIEHDPAQEEVLRALERLADELSFYRPFRKSSALGWLGGGRDKSVPRGAYIWGSVGRGKTMLMDLFFDEVQVSHKKRLHFHAFMADVHARIFAFRQKLKKGEVKGDDPIGPVAEEIAAESWLICLDELFVADIADAMILGRLFKALFQSGVVLVATSNVEPQDLYKEGLNRTLFLPFIDLIREKLDVLELAARTDFRLEKLTGAPVYHVPADDAAHAALTRAFAALTGFEAAGSAELEVLGRTILIPQAKAHVARFDFADLCMAPLGPQDFLAIAENFHTVIIDRIPVLQPEQTNEAKRFILLIDAFYDQKVKLIASAEAEPESLYLGQSAAFEFARTASRLVEMRSAAYLGQPHGLSQPKLADGANLGADLAQ